MSTKKSFTKHPGLTKSPPWSVAILKKIIPNLTFFLESGPTHPPCQVDSQKIIPNSQCLQKVISITFTLLQTPKKLNIAHLKHPLVSPSFFLWCKSSCASLFQGGCKLEVPDFWGGVFTNQFMSFAAVASSSVAAVTQTATFLKLKGGALRWYTGDFCMAIFEGFPPKKTVDGNQKSGKLTSWGW